MTYATEQAKASREVQWLVEIVLDRCTLTYTQAPCTASDQGDGLRCHYSFPTCQDESNFTKGSRTMYFCLNEVPWTDPDQIAYPYLQSFVPVPQKIDAKSLEVYPAKITVKLAYDFNPPPMDHDKGSGFFNTARTGEFWRNLIARNRNYAGRSLRILRGFRASGFQLASFQQVGPSYRLRQIKRKKDHVEVIAESILAYLKDRVLPFEAGEDNTIQDSGGIDAADTTINVVDGARYPDPSDYSRNNVYVGVDSEIMELTNLATNTMTVTRGVLGTAAATHDEGSKVSHVLFIGTDNGTAAPSGVTAMAAMQDMLEWCDISASDVDTTTFDSIEEGLFPSEDVQRILWRPKKVSKLIYQLRRPRDIALFLNSSDKWTVGVPGYTISSASLNEYNFVEDSVTIDEDEDQRATRIALFYDGTSTDPGDDASDYSKGVVYVDAELETANNYGEVKETALSDPWLWGDVIVGLATNMAARLLSRYRYGTREWHFDLELVDGDYEVGDQLTLTHSLVVDRQAQDEPRPTFITSKKERSPHVNTYSGVDTGFSGLYMRIGEDSRAEAYDNADPGQRDSYWALNTGRLGSANDPASVFF